MRKSSGATSTTCGKRVVDSGAVTATGPRTKEVGGWERSSLLSGLFELDIDSQVSKNNREREGVRKCGNNFFWKGWEMCDHRGLKS